MAPRLGLRANLPQFTLLVLVNALVGAMIGMERSLLAPLAAHEFGLRAQTAALSFIVAFGLSKAGTNYVAGRAGDRWGRRPVLIAGWLLALPVPFLLMWAPTWAWILAANVLLGVSQGLTWSTTVIMKIDLAGPKQRGLAMGLNEFAGYVAVALSALAAGFVAERWGLRPAPFFLGVTYSAAGLALSILFVRETRGHAAVESAELPLIKPAKSSRGALAIVSQAGFVNNLNDGVAWGLFPVIFARAGLGLADVAELAALYPAVWGVGQLVFGPLSDRVGRKPLIVAGMTVQAVGIGVVAVGSAVHAFAVGQVLLGIGTAMVYPTLLASIGDLVHPAQRASAVGSYRLWRDLGYAAGAVMAGGLADRIGVSPAVGVMAGLTLASGALVLASDVRPQRPQRLPLAQPA